jgi:hypothetical protein
LSYDDVEIDPLTRLAIRHGTDKWGPHFYTPVYHSLFSHLREKPVRLLEIGVGGYGYSSIGGNSLAMWADYFPDGKIVGIDIAEKKLELGPRITLRRGSQDDPAFLQRISGEFGPFDIVIDDGSHVPAHVTKSFSTLFPLIADGGLYVIEDVQTSFWPQWGGSLADGGATMLLAGSMLHHLNYAEIKIAKPDIQVMELSKWVRSLRAYHNIIVVEKGDNTEPSNFDYQLNNKHAARAVRSIERELERSPTPEGFANLINVYVGARDYPKALACVDKAMAQWRNHPMILDSAFRAAASAGELDRKLEYVRRLAQQEGGNPEVQKMLQRCESEAAARTSR